MLQSQLSALSMASAPPKPKLKPQPKPQPKAPDTFDIEQFSALTEGDDDIEVELTEEDMNDPKLLVWVLSLSLLFIYFETVG